MVKRKHKVNSKPVRSIIAHTTACPYCGHRLLHKNRNAHIKQQHPDRYESEVIASQIDESRKPAICPHCHASMLISELESHIQEKHRVVISQADAKVREKERVERTEKRRRRLRIASQLASQIAYTVRVDRPIEPIRGQGTVKRKPVTRLKGINTARKKSTLKPKTSVQPVDKSRGVNKRATQNESGASKSVTPELMVDFYCETCGRNIVAQAVTKHKMDDFFLRRQVRWWMAGNGSSTVHCPICEQEISQTLLSSHLEEKHPIFYRFATT